MQPVVDPSARPDRVERPVSGRIPPSRASFQAAGVKSRAAVDSQSPVSFPASAEPEDLPEVEVPPVVGTPPSTAAHAEAVAGDSLATPTPTPGHGGPLDELAPAALAALQEPLRAQAPVFPSDFLWPSTLLAQAPAERAGSVWGDASPIPATTVSGGFFTFGWPVWLGVGSLAVVAGSRHGGSSSDTPSTPTDPPTTYTITGGLLAGPIIKPLTVTAYDAQGHELGRVNTAANGDYTLVFSSPAFTGGVLLLRVTDPTPNDASADFIDEANGPSQITDMRAVVYVNPPASSGASLSTGRTPVSVTLNTYITPLSTLAAELIAPLPDTSTTDSPLVWKLDNAQLGAEALKALITGHNQTVATVFGLGSAVDLTSAQPVAVIHADNSANAASNLYGKALAMLSLAQAQAPGLTIQTLADDLRLSGATHNAQPRFSDAVTTELQAASLFAVEQQLLSMADASKIQAAVTGSHTEAVVDFRFLTSERNLTPTQPLDPSQALGQTVYSITKLFTSASITHPQPDNGLLMSNVNTDASHFGWTLTDTTPNAGDASDFTLTADGRLVLNNTAAVAQRVQAPGGHTYRITVNARAEVDPRNTADPSDDISLSTAHQLTLTVKDITAPVVATTPTGLAWTVKHQAGVSVVNGVTTVGRQAAQAAAGFLQLSGLVQAASDPDVQVDVKLVLTRSGGQGVATLMLTDVDLDSLSSPRLTDADLQALGGDGPIAVKTTVTARDLAGNVSAPVILNALQATSFVLDTQAIAPEVKLVGDVVTQVVTQGVTTVVHTSGQKKVQLKGLEPGGVLTYRVDDAAAVRVTNLASSNITLELPDLTSGEHTIAVFQTDRVGNQSPTTTFNFQLALDYPTGMDAHISQFAYEVAGEDGVVVPTAVDDRLFWLKSDPPTLSGVVRGTLSSGNHLVLGVTNTLGVTLWSPLALSPEQLNQLQQTGEVAWHHNPTLSNGSGQVSIGLVDPYGNTNVLTTRAYVFQDDTVLPAPTVQWLGAVDTQTITGQATSVLRVAITGQGLKPHAIAQYQWVPATGGATLSESAWSNTLVQPSADGTYSLFVRQFDLLTQKASEPSEPLLIDRDTTPPSPISPIATTGQAGLEYFPIDGGGASIITRSTLADSTLIDGTDFHRARTVGVRHTWSDMDVGGTLLVQWGRVLTTHTLTSEDVSDGVVYIEWTVADLLNQPGDVVLQAWTTDPSGNTSAVTTRQFTVDPAYTADAITQAVNPVEAGAPQVLGWYTRTSATADYGLDANHTFNLAEASNGVKVKVKLPVAADGSPLNWVNGSTGKAFMLTLQAKSPTAAWSSTGEDNMASRTFTVSDIQNGMVEWVLPSGINTGVWLNPDEARRDWRVQVLNYSYGVTHPLRLTETALSRVGVDLDAPSGVSLSVSDSSSAVSLGLNQAELTVTVGYAGMSVGDLLVFQSQVHGETAGGLEVLRHRLTAADIRVTQGVSTATVRLARDAIAQGRGDEAYDLGVVVTDVAGNSTALSSGAKPRITVDTQAPSAPGLACVQGQDVYLNRQETDVDIVVTWPAGTARLDTDQVRWVLGGADVTPADLISSTSTTATYRFLKADLGPEGIKDMRAQLVDASGNLGAYSAVLRLVSDWQAHDAPVVGVSTTPDNQPALKAGASVTLDIQDAQMVVGDQVQVWIKHGSNPPVSWGSPITITDPLHPRLTHITVTQADIATRFGNNSDVYQVTATVTDLAGNVSAASRPCDLVVDVIAPINEVTTGTFSLESHATTADANAGFITAQPDQIIHLDLNTALQTATGAISAESLWVRIVAQDGSAATAWVNLSSSMAGSTLTWDTHPTYPTYSGLQLLPGANTIEVQVRDLAGNASTSVFRQDYVLDTQGPTTSVEAGSFSMANDSAPTGIDASTPVLNALVSDLKTRVLTQQTLHAQLSTPLHDGSQSALGAAKEYLWGSLDNGATWVDLSGWVSGQALAWNTPLAFSAADAASQYGVYRALLEVRDVAGNAGPRFAATYVLDQAAPSARVSQLQLVDETGFDPASLHDFITNGATTSLDITFTSALTPDDRVLVQTGQNQTPIDITAEVPDVFVLGGTYTVDNLTLLSGSHALSVWVEDDVGNKGPVFTQAYVYAATLPLLDLDGASAATSLTSHVSTVAAQRGVVLGNQIGVTGLLPSVGIADIQVTFGVDGNSNGNSERLWVKSGLDIHLNAASATLRGLQFAGIDGYVTLQPGGGSELHFSKTSDASGHTTAYFSASEVQSLLGGLRYFNTANVDAIETGERTFDVQLTDRATNVSETQTATIRVTAPSPGDTSGADVGNNTIIGTGGDDILFGLRGNDTLTGAGGNNTFMWVSGDAFSAAGVAGSVGSPVTDRVSDFIAWNDATQSGDRLDIAKLLVGYTSNSSLSQWVTAVQNGVTYQDGLQGARLTIDVNGSASGGAVQVIELQGVTLGSPAANTPALLLSELVSTQQLKVL